MQENLSNTSRGKSLLLGEGETLDMLDSSLVRKRLRLLRSELDETVAYLRSIDSSGDAHAAADFFGRSHSSAFEPVLLEGARVTANDLELLSAQIQLNRVDRSLRELGRVATEISFGRSPTTGRLRVEPTPRGDIFLLGADRSRLPYIGCSDAAHCQIGWRSP